MITIAAITGVASLVCLALMLPRSTLIFLAVTLAVLCMRYLP